MLAATAKDYIEATGWVGSDLVVQNNRERVGGGEVLRISIERLQALHWE